MAIEKKYHAYCDRCGCEHYLLQSSKSELTTALITSGWVQEGDKDFCPLCYRLLNVQPFVQNQSQSAVQQQEKSSTEDQQVTIKEYLNEHEVSEITGISVSSLRSNRFQMKGLPYLKIGRSVRYRLSDIYDYLDSKVIKPKY